MIEPPIDERYELAAVKESLTTDERTTAEETYTRRAFDYEQNPVGSRDWTLFWSGWCARATQPSKAQPPCGADGAPRSRTALVDDALAAQPAAPVAQSERFRGLADRLRKANKPGKGIRPGQFLSAPQILSVPQKGDHHDGPVSTTVWLHTDECAKQDGSVCICNPESTNAAPVAPATVVPEEVRKMRETLFDISTSDVLSDRSENTHVTVAIDRDTFRQAAILSTTEGRKDEN